MFIDISYGRIIVAGILAMILGALWYGPLFGKKWMEIVGASPEDMANRERMQAEARPLYVIQFLLVLLQAGILSVLVQDTRMFTSLGYALLAWLAFVMPTIAGTAMWNNNPPKVKWAQFWIQSMYQLIVFIIFGIILSW